MVLDWFKRYDTEWFNYTHMPTFIWNSIKQKRKRIWIDIYINVYLHTKF